MKNNAIVFTTFRSLLAGIAATFGLLGMPAHGEEAPPSRLQPVPIQQVTIEDEFWSPKRKVWQEVTIPDILTKFEKAGVLQNYDRVRDGQKGGHADPVFHDGLICETIRGAADFLAAHRDPVLENRLDGYIDRIAAAQAKDPDGYLNTATTLSDPNHRWGLNGGNDVVQHDVYNAGCLVEAGVHYYLATGKTKLLEVAARLTNHMCDVMGPPPKKNVIPGHAVSEEAVTDLYLVFRNQPELKKRMPFPVDENRYLKLAEFWIEYRGNHEGRPPFAGFAESYGQDHMSVFKQTAIEGHAVRATLMCTGLSALAIVNGRDDYRQAAERLWTNLTTRRMYVTGGAGVTSQFEAFAPDYVLPNDGYLESRAAIGSAFFSRNMNLLCGDARYADELERVLYNGALCAVSLKGNTYYYENPLEMNKPTERWAWHGCPCCPPMFLKLMGAMPGYIYATSPQKLCVNLLSAPRPMSLSMDKSSRFANKRGIRGTATSSFRFKARSLPSSIFACEFPVGAKAPRRKTTSTKSSIAPTTAPFRSKSTASGLPIRRLFAAIWFCPALGSPATSSTFRWTCPCDESWRTRPSKPT